LVKLWLKSIESGLRKGNRQKEGELLRLYMERKRGFYLTFLQRRKVERIHHQGRTSEGKRRLGFKIESKEGGPNYHNGHRGVKGKG